MSDLTTAPVLELRDVTRIHGSGVTAVHALRGVSLSVQAGELVAVMGPSGSGKSTLLNVAGGLDTATTGSVRVEGVDLASLSRADLAAVRRRSAGYVFQDLNLIPTLTAAENVALCPAVSYVPSPSRSHAYIRASPSASEPLALTVIELPSSTLYGPPADTVGAAFGLSPTSTGSWSDAAYGSVVWKSVTL